MQQKTKISKTKTVDSEFSENYDRKRIEVLEATWRAILLVGLENVTFREIASQMKATTGTIVHYFRTKDEVLLYALDHLISEMQDNIEKYVGKSTGLNRIERTILATLPLDEESEMGWRIWFAFLKSSIGNNRLSNEHGRRYIFMRESLVAELDLLRAQNLIRCDANLTLEADAIVALADGIGVGRIIDPNRFPPKQQKVLVKRHIQAFLC